LLLPLQIESIFNYSKRWLSSTDAFTLSSALLTNTTCQLSVENAIANKAAETKEKMEAKHNVTALQKAMAANIFKSI
jgi:hypothetical protein